MAKNKRTVALLWFPNDYGYESVELDESDLIPHLVFDDCAFCYWGDLLVNIKLEK